MKFDLDTCRFIVFGYRNTYHTHGHIHDAINKALVHMGKDSQWVDTQSDIDLNQPNTFFITNHDVACQLPIREDCFYLIHGGADYAPVREKFWHLPHMSWNVFIDANYTDVLPSNLAPADSKGRRPINRPPAIWVGENMPYYPDWNHLDFRWATDLLPYEIEANKVGARLLNTDSRVINWVGTFWQVNEKEIGEFRRACNDNGIEFKHYGAGQADGDGYLGNAKVVSPRENVRLIRESYFAPAVVGSHHLSEGYMPCRIMKNISYGQFGVTNSEKVQRAFGGRLICNSDPYKLFYEARERLSSMSIEDLYSLMDYVAKNHTYLNRLDGIFKATALAIKL